MKPTLVLLPGWGANETIWEDVIEHLSELVDCKVILFRHHTSRDQMVEDLLKQAPERFILAGQSMGGWVALKTAATAPQRVSHLILVNTWASPDPKLNELQKDLLRELKNGIVEQVLERHLAFIFHHESLQKPEVLDKAQRTFAHCKSKVLIDQMQAILDDYVSLPLLPHITMPTLIIHGREDMLFTTSEQEMLHKQIKQSQLKIIVKCGHCSPLEHPQETTALIKNFVLSECKSSDQ